MGLLSYFDDIITNQPLGSTDASIATNQAQDAQLAALNAKDYAADGVIGQAVVASQGEAALAGVQAQVNSDEAAQQADTANISTGIAGAFVQGAADAALSPWTAFKNGLDALLNAFKNGSLSIWAFIAHVIGLLLSSIPFWVYLVLFTLLFLWLGGGGFAERKARKALSK